MMHNPFQSYHTDPTLAAYAGITNPFGLPTTALQTAAGNPAALNPLAATLGMISPLAGIGQLGQTGYPGIPPIYGQNPGITGQSPYIGQNPFVQNPYLQNPYLQNPYGQSQFGQNPLHSVGLQNPILSALQNPWLSAILAQQQNPWLNPLLTQQHAHQQGLFGSQQGSPYGQFGYGQSGYGQSGFPLAPQSFLGQGAFGGTQALGQIHPLAAQQFAQQCALRALQSQGQSPWGF